MITTFGDQDPRSRLRLGRAEPAAVALADRQRTLARHCGRRSICQVEPDDQHRSDHDESDTTKNQPDPLTPARSDCLIHPDSMPGQWRVSIDRGAKRRRRFRADLAA
jgi:hypothetical protein